MLLEGTALMANPFKAIGKIFKPKKKGDKGKDKGPGPKPDPQPEAEKQEPVPPPANANEVPHDAGNPALLAALPQPVAATTNQPINPDPVAEDPMGLEPVKRKKTAAAGTPTADAPADEDQEKLEYPVDIVAIHGITGGAYRTFTTDDNVFWLRDFLLDDMPGARVFTYGYGASVFFTKSEGTLDDFALALLAGLKLKRPGTNKKRPLIFVCHSMGGLVAKRAVNIATLSRQLYGDIVDACYGIAFLSTPHRGSDATPFPTLLANLANLATPVLSRLIGKSRSDLIKMLDKDAKELQKLSADFVSRLFDIKVGSFVEQLATPPANKRIVDNTTGVIGSPGEQWIPMQGCDHSSVCRFSTRDNNYGLLLGVLQEWGGDATGANQGNELTEIELDCLKGLKFEEMNFRKIQLLGGTSGTTSCKWIFDNPTYVTWFTSPDGALWIKGKPGAGKSTIMEFLVEHCEARQKTQGLILLSFFFNAFGIQELHKSPLGLYLTLLYQLMEQAPGTLKNFAEYCQKRWRVSPELKGLWHENEKNTLRAHLNEGLLNLEKSPRPVMIFVDAVDEAVHGSGNDLAMYLHQLDKLLRSKRIKVRTCISCRHFPILQAPQKHCIVVERENHLDIESYIKSKLDVDDTNIILPGRYQKSGFLEKLQREIRARSHGVFLWVYLVMPFVVTRLNQAPTKTDVVLHALDELEIQTRLGEIYADILSNVIAPDDRLDAYMLFCWATTAMEPLRLRELISQVQFSDAYMVDVENLEEELPAIEFRVGNLSGGLMEVLRQTDGERATFIHPSVKKFLLADGLKSFKELLDSSTKPRAAPPEADASALTISDAAEDFPSTTAGPSETNIVPLSPTERPRPLRKRSSILGNYLGRKRLPEDRQDVREADRDKDLNPTQSTTIQADPADEEHKRRLARLWMSQWQTCLALIHSRMKARPKRIKIAVLDKIDQPIDSDLPPHVKHRIIELWPPDPQSDVSSPPRRPGKYSLLLASFVPFADIYPAIITERGSAMHEEVAKAIDWAASNKVDIIAFTAFFIRPKDIVKEAIRQAARDDILIFAAAGSEGLRQSSLPPEEVIVINSADGYGRISPWNPPALEYSENFAVLGEGITLPDWVKGDKRTVSGTSFSTILSAGIAAAVLNFAVQLSQDLFPRNYLRQLHTRAAMRLVFRYMSASRVGSYSYITPWKLLKAEENGSIEKAGRRLRVILDEIGVER